MKEGLRKPFGEAIMKRFRYDVLLPQSEICNLKREYETILAGVDAKEKLIVYGPRNYGKTSLVQNVVIPKYIEHYSRAFVLSVDLMQVKNLDSISDRVRSAFERAFLKTYPGESLLGGIKKHLLNLRPTAEVDTNTGNVRFSIASVTQDKKVNFSEILQTIHQKIAQELPTLLVFDEFQDVSFVEEAEGLLRSELQHFTNTPIIFMGSKRHILGKMFAKTDAPFANFGRDVEFSEIDYHEYHAYILERLAPAGLQVAQEVSKYWQDRMNRIPESINIVGAKIVDLFSGKELAIEDIEVAVASAIEDRKSVV